ncbi:hypothetical protein [Stenotrophomonas humi]
MIDIQLPLITYSPNRPPFHDGMNEERACAKFRCASCGGTVELNVLSGISSGREWFWALPLQDQELIARAFSCTLEFIGPKPSAYPRFPNGDAAYFCTVQCGNCRAGHVVAIEFYEKQPARYIAVLQGVAGLAPNNSFKPKPLRGAA